MINLNISVHQGNEDGTDSYIALDVLSREDASKLELKIIKALETYMFDMIKVLPQLKLTDTRVLQQKEYNDDK